MDYCERCGEPLNPKTLVVLELDQDTGLYGWPGNLLGTNHTSQGGFTFGSACAKAVLKAGGHNHKIRRKTR